MIDWNAIARARKLDIPSEAIAGISPALDELETAFRPLLNQLRLGLEPAVIVSETATSGE